MARPKLHQDELFGIVVYLPKSTVAEIDAIVKNKRSRIPRTAWLREAVYEKLEREKEQEGGKGIR